MDRHRRRHLLRQALVLAAALLSTGLTAREVEDATGRRVVVPDRVERVINSIVRQLESSGETEIPSDMIGELVMEALSTLDQVAYIRFASVYRNFREAKDFRAALDELSGDETAGKVAAPARK